MAAFHSENCDCDKSNAVLQEVRALRAEVSELRKEKQQPEVVNLPSTMAPEVGSCCCK